MDYVRESTEVASSAANARAVDLRATGRALRAIREEVEVPADAMADAFGVTPGVLAAYEGAGRGEDHILSRDGVRGYVEALAGLIRGSYADEVAALRAENARLVAVATATQAEHRARAAWLRAVEHGGAASGAYLAEERATAAALAAAGWAP